MVNSWKYWVFANMKAKRDSSLGGDWQGARIPVPTFSTSIVVAHAQTKRWRSGARALRRGRIGGLVLGW